MTVMTHEPSTDKPVRQSLQGWCIKPPPGPWAPSRSTARARPRCVPSMASRSSSLPGVIQRSWGRPAPASRRCCTAWRAWIPSPLARPSSATPTSAPSTISSSPPCAATAWVRLPVVQPGADYHHSGKHQPPPASRRPERGSGVDIQDHRHDGHRVPAEAPPGRDVRGPAAAGSGGQGAGQPSRDHLRRRAHRQPGLPGGRRGAHLHAPGRGRDGPDDRHGYARPDRSQLRRPDRVPC